MSGSAIIVLVVAGLLCIAAFVFGEPLLAVIGHALEVGYAALTGKQEN